MFWSEIILCIFCNVVFIRVSAHSKAQVSIIWVLLWESAFLQKGQIFTTWSPHGLPLYFSNQYFQISSSSNHFKATAWHINQKAIRQSDHQDQGFTESPIPNILTRSELPNVEEVPLVRVPPEDGLHQHLHCSAQRQSHRQTQRQTQQQTQRQTHTRVRHKHRDKV